MKPYAELLEFNQPSSVRREGHTKIRDAYPGLKYETGGLFEGVAFGAPGEFHYDPERIVEFAGRSDYGVQNVQKLGSDDSIISRWIDSGHHSMLEFAEATFYIECSRVVSHELVRHRLASFQQESQRYVKYDEVSFEELFMVPDDLTEEDRRVAQDAISSAKEAYDRLRVAGVKAQLARYVLPNATATRMVMKANLREWRHIINLRTSKAAQPEMQKLMEQIYEQLLDIFPNMLYNVKEQEKVR